MDKNAENQMFLDAAVGPTRTPPPLDESKVIVPTAPLPPAPHDEVAQPEAVATLSSDNADPDQSGGALEQPAVTPAPFSDETVLSAMRVTRTETDQPDRAIDIDKA